MTGIETTASGNLTDTPELRFTPAGTPVALFTLAVNERFRRGDGWEDGPVSFLRCVAWRSLAEHVCESAGKGDRLIVRGTMRERAYEVTPARDGDTGKRRVWELTASEVGAALTYATVKITRAARDGGAPLPDDPWGGAPAPAAPAEDEPPF